MPRSPENRGACAYCGETLTRRSVPKHLAACAGRRKALETAEASRRPSETLWHLRISDAYNKDFWFDVEMNGPARLETLDRYLRAIWLECCGHMSDFTIGGWGGPKVGKTDLADRVFKPDLVLRHLYDFGTTSETDIRVIGSRAGRPVTRHPIALLARNLQPPSPCRECGKPGTWLCIECLYESDEPGTSFLCDEHEQDHPHDEYGDPFPVVNSPRLGMCGYDGPAEAPY